MANLTEHASHAMGMHTEQLEGRSQQRFFSGTEAENLTQPFSYEVDFERHAKFDAQDLTPRDINKKIRDLIGDGALTTTGVIDAHDRV